MEAKQTKSVAGSRILVVDDEPILTLTFRALLEKAGATVFTAGHGGEALPIVERERLDCILCDRYMPVMDGVVFLRELQARSIRIPTLLFLSALDPAETAELKCLGVWKVLSKPLLPPSLLEELAALLAEAGPEHVAPAPL